MNIGLVLSGGFGKGAYQAGALKAIVEKIPFEDIKYVSATSIGCLNAYAYAAGTPEYAEEAWSGINKTQENVLLTELYKNGYLDSICSHLGELDCKADFYLSVLKMGRGNRQVEYINMRKVDDPQLRKNYLRAGIAVPFLSRSVKIDGCRYFDGGTVDNNPTEPLLDKELDLIIVLCFDHSVKFTDDKELKKKILPICFDDGDRIKKEMYFNSRSVQTMISCGEKYTRSVLDYVFEGENIKVKKIHSRVKDINKLQAGKKNKKWIAISSLLTELNKITKKMCKEAPPTESKEI